MRWSQTENIAWSVQLPGWGTSSPVVYAKDSEPLQVLALQKLDLIQDLPVELEWKRGEKDADTLTLNILGRYQAVLTVTRR